MNVIRKLRILVVEDEELIGADLVRRLERFGHQPIWARSLDELSSCLEDAHDLILAKPSLAGGRDVLEAAAAAARNRGIPLLVFSSVVDEALIERASVLGVWKIIPIPFMERQLGIDVTLAAAYRASAAFPCGLEEGGEGVLIIEDEKIIQLDMARRIERFGFKVVGMVPSAAEGIEATERLRPALVTTGICLAGHMHGIEGAEVLRNRFSIPLIYVTGYTDEATLKRVADTRPDDFILKPYKDRELLASLRLALDRQSRQVRTDDPSGIFAAARRGGAAEVSEALGRGGEPSARDPGGKTPLMYAARCSDRPEALTALLDAGAAIDAMDGRGRTALMYSMANASTSMCQVLLERGADFAVRDAEGLAVLDHWRLGRSEACALSLLYRAGLDPRTRLVDGRSVFTALLDAGFVLQASQFPTYLQVLREAGVEIDRSEFSCLGPEILASIASSSESLAALAVEGLEADTIGQALLVAVRRGDEAAVRALLDSGANPEFPDSEGRSPLVVIWRHCGYAVDVSAYAKIVANLAEAGGRLDREFLGEPSAAGLAAFAEALPDKVAGLIAPEAVDKRDGYNDSTALVYAAESLGPRAVECLLALGANPLAKSRWKDSAVELARSNPALSGSPALEALRRAEEKARLGAAPGS